MVVEPFFLPFTTPFDVTVAIFLFFDEYLTVPFGVFFLIFMVTVLFFFMVADVLESVSTGLFTVILHVLVIPLAFALIVAFPAFLAVTLPDEFTDTYLDPDVTFHVAFCLE